MKLKNIAFSPSKITNEFWIFCKEDAISKKYPANDGKWMMFFPLSELDLRWNEACGLFRAGKLKGINSMKVSTAKPNPKAIYAKGEGIIIFYCGASENRANVLDYGKNILIHMKYPRLYFFYKSDKPHLIKYENVYKHLYFIRTLVFLKLVNSQNQSRLSQVSNLSHYKNIKKLSDLPKVVPNRIDQIQNKPVMIINSTNSARNSDVSPTLLNIRSNSTYPTNDFNLNNSNQNPMPVPMRMHIHKVLSKSIQSGLHNSDAQIHDDDDSNNNMRSKSVLHKNFPNNSSQQRIIPLVKRPSNNVENFYMKVYNLPSFNYTDTVADVKQFINIQ